VMLRTASTDKLSQQLEAGAWLLLMQNVGLKHNTDDAI
jgi:hypothetical protein